MAAASVSFNGIVSEVLTNDNYENWSALVKNYLIGQGFWDVVSSSSAKSGDEDWKMKNGKALHAIQLSCGSDALAWIRNCETAKEAWNQLSFSFSSDMGGDRDTELGIMDDIVLGHNNMKKLRRHVETGNWDAANYYIDKNKDDPDVVFSACSLGRTILHIAVIAGREEIVEKLIEAVKDKEKLLKSKDNRGYTALALAAKFTDKLRMAKFMVEKCKDLLTINSMDDEIPVLLASANGHKEMTRYLYSQTPWDEMSEGQVVHYGGLLLTRCISAQIFYVALTLLRRQNPSIPLTHESENLRPLYVLSQMPHVFPSGYHTKTVFERFLYEVLEVDSKSYSDSLSRNIINKTSHADQHKGREASEQLFPLTLIVWTPLQNVILENLSVLLGFKEIYEAKLTHYLVSEILKELERRIYKFHESELKSASAYNAMLLAAQGGIRELVHSMSRANPDLLWAIDKNNKGTISYAIMNRRLYLLNKIHESYKEKMQMISLREDEFGNNMLHLTAKSVPPFLLDHISNPVLQIYKEVQFYKKVEGMVHPKCKEAKNVYGRKPREVFSESHKELAKVAEKRAKGSATSFTLVGTLIIAIMFAAAFTVPGGFNQDTGIPILLNSNWFSVFFLADAISLFLSVNSVLIFVRILSFSYTKMDHLELLPIQLAGGINFLFVSVIFMTLAFCAALTLTLKGHLAVVVVATVFACFAVLPFAEILLPLYNEFENFGRAISRALRIVGYAIKLSNQFTVRLISIGVHATSKCRTVQQEEQVPLDSV